MTDHQDIVILTGAGVSAESGLCTFRDAGGIWTKYDLEEVATPEGFAKNPALVHEFYNARRANCLNASHNAAHLALGRLQAEHPGRVSLITQNIDDLHERGGARDIIHMHGEILRALCAACDHRWDAPRVMDPAAPCPNCGRAATRPDIVWFGEIPYQMERIYGLLAEADLFVAIGTSGTVYPAAGFVGEAHAMGIATLEINLEPSEGSALFDRTLHGPATETVPDWVKDVLGG